MTVTGVKFKIFNGTVLRDELSGDRVWYMIAKRKMSNGIDKCLWVSRDATTYWAEYDYETHPALIGPQG